MAAPAADSGGDAIETIVVTARKRAEALQDAPVSITTFNGEAIEREGINNLQDVARLTPGLIYDQGINGDDTRPAIRGISDQRGRPGVAVLVDGIDTSGQAILFAGGSAMINLDLQDLDQIEIVKGPQSVLYGRNAFAGAINYVTKAPSQTFEGELEFGVAQGGLLEDRGGLSGPLTDKVLFRANFETRFFDGFYRNQLNGAATGATSSKGVSLAVEFLPTDALSIIARFQYSRSQEKQAPAVLDGGTNASLTTINGQGVYIGTLTADPSQVKYAGDLSGMIDSDTRSTIDAKYDFGWATLSSLTGIVTDDTSDNEDANFSFLPVGPFGTRQIGHSSQQTVQASEDLHLASAADSKIKWLGGVYYFFENARATNAGTVDAGYCGEFIQYFIPNLGCASAATGLPVSPSKIPPLPVYRQTQHGSAYGSISYEVFPKLNATVEARYAVEDVHAAQPGYSHEIAEEYSQSFDGGLPIAYTPNGYLAAIPRTIAANIATYYFNPRFTLDYHLTDDVMAYATVSKGSKPGGVNQVLGTTDRYDIGRYAPEKLWSYEGGLKTEWLDKTLIVDGDVFYMDYSNQQQVLLSVVPGVAFPISTVQNIGSIHSYGAELGSAWKPVKPVTLSLSYTYDNARVASFNDNSSPAPILFPPDGNLRGKRVPGVPTNSLAFTARYDGMMFGDLAWFVEGVTTYQSDRYVNGDEFNFKRLAAFAQEDFRFGLSRDKWMIEGYVNNAFDDLTVRNGISYYNVASGAYQDAAVAYLTNPRQFGGRFTFKF